MKPTGESYQAATKVNAMSPETRVIEEADSVSALEGSIGWIAMVRAYLFLRDRRQQQGNEWNTSERGRPCRTSDHLLGIAEYKLRRRGSCDVFWISSW